MKITTWNVNGIRAVLNKGLAEWVQSCKPDVLCLQEVKARPDQVPGVADIFPGADVYWNPAERPGYSGVATFTTSKPCNIVLGLGDPRFDVEGRVVRTDYDHFVLYNIYFPNGQRGHDRVAFKLDFYAMLLEECNQLHTAGKNIIITGDFNTAHQEIDLKNPRQNSTTSGFLPEERAWVERFLQNGFADAFRRLYPSRVQYTWWTYISNARQRNVGWRLDYFLVSEGFMRHVEDVVIHEEVMGSDHCPVSLLLN